MGTEEPEQEERQEVPTDGDGNPVQPPANDTQGPNLDAPPEEAAQPGEDSSPESSA